MRYIFGFLFACALGMVPLVGCGESAAGCEDAEDGTACSDGACLAGQCTALVAVSGSVVVYETLEDEEGSPAVAATVSVHGTVLITTTDDRGEFSLGVFAGESFFQTSKKDTWGWIEPANVPTTGQSDLELSLVADEVMTELENMLTFAIDDSKGAVSLAFIPNSGQGGETATLSEPHGGAYTEDADGELVESEKLVAGGEADLDFLNVDLTEALIVTPKGVPGVNTCKLKDPDMVYPVVAKSWTVGVRVECTPDS